MVTRASDLRADPRPIDKDVKVPQAVLRAAAAAEAAQRAAYPDQNPPTPEPQPPAPNGDTITIADPNTPPPAPPAPEPQPPAPQTPPVTPPGNEPPPPKLTAEAELEVQRVRSEEGRRRKQLENQLLAANDRLASLESMVEELRRSRAPAATPTAPPAPLQLLTEQERSEFGTEMLDVMGRRAKEIVSPELAELREHVKLLEQQLTGTVKATAQTARQTMLSRLDDALPEWRQINVQPDFKNWLALQDPLFGASRQSALLQAYEQNDTVRVLNFFKGFISELAAQDPAPSLPPAPATPPAPPKPGLEHLAAPGRARTSAQPNAPAEKQIITTADVNAFYDAKRKGFYRGREAEADALEQELFAAQREGRVRAS